MQILPINCISRTKSAIKSIIPAQFSFGRIKTQISDTFERISASGAKFNGNAGTTGKSKISAHDSLVRPNLHLRDFMENPNSRFKKDPEVRGRLEKLISETDKEFEELPPISTEMTVWRGRSMHPSSKRLNRDFGIIAAAKEGDIITPDNCWAHAHYERAMAEAEKYSHINFEDIGTKKINGIIYEVVLPAGSKVSKGETVLMPRGANYQILEKAKEQDGGTFVKMKYILPQK